MKWFKHYNTASDGNSIKLLMAEEDYEGIAFYWWLLEAVSRWEDQESRGQVTLSYKLIKRELGWNFQRTSRVLGKIGSRFHLRIEHSSEDKTFKVFVPNWLKLQENRGGKKIAEKIETPAEVRSKSKEVRDKNKEGSFDPRCGSILEVLNKELRKEYKPVPYNLRHIASRLKEGFTDEQFQKVIEFKKSEWEGTNMETYLRPETLFGPKFDSYLQAANSKKEIGNKW